MSHFSRPNKHKVHRYALIFMLSALVFLVLSLTMFISVALLVLWRGTGFLQDVGGWVEIVSFAICSIVIGTLLAHVLMLAPIRPLRHLRHAMNQVAKGNFTVHLSEERLKSREIQDMVRSFNVMVQELASNELLRSDFIENVSHEFKTPLAAIEGYATLLQRPNLSESLRLEYTQRILFNTGRLSSLTGNILWLNRLENQEISVSRAPFDLDEQLRDTVLMFERDWTGKNIDLDIDLDAVVFNGNQELLGQVWQNLFGNAIKFVDKNGRIRLLLRDHPNQVQVQVADNGLGIDFQAQARIYEKFYQADTSRQTSGNGLGLTLAKRIADLHEGEITVSSIPGKGTTFTVILPKAASESE